MHPANAGEDSFTNIPIAEAVYPISVITDCLHDAIGRSYVRAGGASAFDFFLGTDGAYFLLDRFDRHDIRMFHEGENISA